MGDSDKTAQRRELDAFLYVSEVGHMFGMFGGKKSDVEAALKGKGLMPYGYLRGTQGDQRVMRPFYREVDVLTVLAKQEQKAQKPVVTFAIKKEQSLEERFADLETKVNTLIDSLGG